MKLHIVFYFQVHQPFRLNDFGVLDVGSGKSYFNEALNREIIRKVGDKAYIPANRLLLRLIDKFEGKFKISFSITGMAVEQFKQYYPEVLESFRELARTGCAEFIGETYYHSLAYLFDQDEFIDQVKKHREMVKREFGYSPIVFRNTELIYQDQLSDLVESEGYKVILAEGAERILGGKSPLYAYKNYTGKVYLLLKYYKLSDDIAFRFSDRGWIEYPLTAEKFAKWVYDLPLIEKEDRNLFLNLFMDYETFGEHQWEETGIFKFLEKLPELLLEKDFISFAWPSEVMEIVNYEPEKLSFPEPVSWADVERDLSAWLANGMQRNATKTLYKILKKVTESGDPELLENVRKLTTSDHVYYMSTKYFQDGDVHKYFSPYGTPEEAYLYLLNALADVEERIRKKGTVKL